MLTLTTTRTEPRLASIAALAQLALLVTVVGTGCSISPKPQPPIEESGFDLGMVGQILMPALLLAGAMMLLKPVVFRQLLLRTGESDKRSHEVGYRLGQMSEFSLLLAILALEMAVIGVRASYLIQLATLLTFLISSYLVVLRFPTPIAVSDALRRD